MMKTLLIAAGGTGGHIYPALAVAEKWQEAGGHVEWLGTKQGLEAKIVPEHGLHLNFINVRAIRGKKFLSKLFSPLMLISALAQSLVLLIKIKPKVVLGMGGYASGPGAIAAWLLRIPLVIHEQNSVVGKTNKLLLPFASKILQAFPNTIKLNHTSKTIITCGNPLRKELGMFKPKQRDRNQNLLNILIVGGSRGALKLNQLLPEIFSHKLFCHFNLHIKHQAGANNFESARHVYEAYSAVTAEVLPYIEDMSIAYAWADIVIARAGAMTVFEIMAVARPCIFIPYPYAVDDHQTQNATYLTDKSASFMLQEHELTVENLLPIIQTLYNDFETYNRMSSQLFSLRSLGADELIAGFCRSLAK